MKLETLEKIQKVMLAKYPSAVASVEKFQSGASMLDIKLGKRLFVCSFSPSHGYGIDEVGDNEGLTSSFSHGSLDEDDAIRILTELIEGP